MKKYKLAYDCLFLPSDLDKGITYKGENITDIAVYMVYKIIDKRTGNEVYFSHDELKDQTLEFVDNHYCYANDFYKCFVDKDKGFDMIPNTKLWGISNYIVLYEVGECCKWVNEDPINISYEEFIDILKNNFSEFDNTNNKPTQSVSYYAVEIN